MSRKSSRTSLPAPFLKRLSVLPGAMIDRSRYPFNVGWLTGEDWDLTFTDPVTIIVGENGSGKSTLIEAIAALCGFDEAGGGRGYMPVDHSRAQEINGESLAQVLRAGWLPKIGRGWFFRAETFFSVARYLDQAAWDAGEAPPDFLSKSHGEGFLRFFQERVATQGIFLLDEPESALSPNHQITLLRRLAQIQRQARLQVIMATHSPILSAVPGATLLQATDAGLRPVHYSDTDHFRVYRDFTADPDAFLNDVSGDGA